MNNPVIPSPKPAKIKPTDKKNLPSYKESQVKLTPYDNMPKDWFPNFKKQYSIPLMKKDSIKASDVWENIYRGYGKRLKKNIVNTAKKQNYKTPHYIHKVGLWEDFENYLKERVG